MKEHEKLPEDCLHASPSRGSSEASGSIGSTESDKAVVGSGKKTVNDNWSNLTRNQLQVWVGQKLVPDAPVYHLAAALRILGEIDPLHFQKAFQTLLNSCDALRTVIEEIDGIPMQKVIPHLPYSVDCLDFSRCPDPQEATKNWMQERCQVPLDLRRRLFDSVLIKVSPQEYVWYLNLHHFIGDGWSFELIYRFMADLYRCSFEGRLPETIRLSGFQEYVSHEREYRNSPRYRKAEAYWKKQIAESDDPLSYYGKTAVRQTTRMQRLVRDLGLERTKKLKALVAQENLAGDTEEAALFNTFCALLAAYLYHFTGCANFSIGIPFHNRRSKSFKETIGFFSEVLPLRITIADNETFPSLVGKIKAKVFETIRHSPFALPNPHHRKAYDVIVNYHTASLSHFDGKRAAAEWIHTGHGDESLALQIHDFSSSGALTLNFDFHCDLFTREQCTQSVDRFLQVVDAFLEDFTQPLRRIHLLLPDEKRRILEEWNNTAADYPKDRCIHHLFEEQAERTPDAIGVALEEEQLRYRELNNRTNQLAHHLQSLGVGPDVPVGIYLERSVEMVVGLLGVLKAGGTYIPLDPDYPKERLAFMLEDGQVPILLTQQKLSARLADFATLQNPKSEIQNPIVVCLDTDWESIARESEENPISQVTAENVAYIIYTSGSTGKPKGVEVTHQALVNFTTSACATLALEHDDRVLQFASISFDTAAEEIFPCLLRGATLVLRTDSMLDSMPVFLEKCREWGITVLDLPTAYWNELTAILYSSRLALPEQLRLVIVGGEKALAERLAQWRECVDKNVRLLNTYGPTEATVVATVWESAETEGADIIQPEVPIGRPIPNVQVYLLDKHLNPVPVGAPGELHIGGDGLARGYRNHPELTVEKFIPNPFSNEPGARLYKTGDLVRYRPDGNIEYLRRIDDQVKIRGFRVEPGEIEATLMEHPLVHQAVVVTRGDPSTLVRTGKLVAYVVAKQECTLLTSELRGFLKEKLPEYMVPFAFVPLEALPLTPNGKVDRHALPAPDQSRSETGGNFVAPRIPIEETLAGMWRELLELEEVGIYDNFFELGGHSLLATQVISRVHELFKVDLPLRALFETPTIAKIAEQIQLELSNEHRTLALPPVTAVSREKGLPLSYSQARMWFLHELAPESRAYNIAAPLRLAGVVNQAALEHSLNELVKRHESLRTTFPRVGGNPVQVIAEPQPVSIASVDLREVSEDQRLEEAKRIAAEEARRPFDLDQGPLMRHLLVQLGEEDYVLQLTMHHIISDQWSFSIIAQELASLYNAFCGAPSIPLTPLTVQYADFAVWQRQWLESEVLKTQLSYWKKQLEGLEVLDLPTDYPRPSVQTFHGAHLTMDLHASLIEGLKKLSLREGVTVYMTLLAAFKALLYKYSRQQDIAIGSPIANRNLLSTEGIVGTFVNVLVMRTDLSGEPTFRELLARVREVALRAYAHQEMPFEKLVEELQPERDMSHSPLVQVLFNLHNAPMREVNLLGLSWHPFEIDLQASQFDIGISIDTEITKKIMLAYNTDLYHATTIQRMLRHYLSLLEEVIADPEVQISQMKMLSEEEQRKILFEWNDTGSDYHREACLPQLFEAQAERNPQAIAACMEDESLSYFELNARANQLARLLRSLGVGPETRVAICMQRSLDMLVCLLGVLKAGGAYLPIDPDYPSQRISFMLEDSEARLLLTQERVAQALPECGVRVMCVEQILKKAVRRSKNNLPRRAGPQSLAYIIYTSGSTGKPKGVEISHGALVNFLESMCRTPGLSKRDVLLSVTTLSFDIAGLELYLPLIVGGRVELVGREVVADGARLMERLASTKATVMQATPATWRLLLQSGWKGSKRLKILCGGEELSRDLAKALLERGKSVWNLYGPTETTIWSTVWKVKLAKGPLSIGRPIANTQVYILDANLQPTPVGIPGELYIGGEGLARGYLKRPELTVEKFVAHPFSATPGARLYRTGDLARYLPEGNIEFLGRIDHQVKVRGFRIELGEIENTLCQHPEVKESVVVAREDVPGDVRLLAYIVPERQQAPVVSELRGFLKQKIPDYMVPSAFVLLDALPLTPNGKLNRRALPEPDGSGLGLEHAFIGPRTPVEEMVAGIWSQVLRLSSVSIQDNFFDLGGHSLLATQVVSRVRDIFQMELPLRSFFETPTVARIAEIIEATRRASQSPPAPPMLRVSRDRNLPLSFAQQRLWFLNQLEPKSPAYNIPGAVRLAGPLDVTALERSLTEIVRRHEALRTTFASTSDGLLAQIILPAEPIPLSAVDLTEFPEAEREKKAQHLVVEEAKQPFDLARGPLIRAKLLRLGEEKHLLVLVIHHIASDGWSHGVLFREIATLYKSFSAGNSSPLPELPIQYADFAVWQREWLQGEILETQVSYWKKQLHGVPPMLDLPTDRPRLPVQTFRGARESLHLSPTLTEALKELSRREGLTLFMTILAAFQTLLHRYTGQGDILIGSPIANRTRAEIEGLIGFFANTLVLRTDHSGNPSFRELLGRVREVALGAYAHQDLPFEKLVEELRPKRHLSHTPLFQVMFVLQNTPSDALEVPELSLSPLEVGSETSKFDLTLSMIEGRDSLRGVMEYSTDLFDASTVRRMLDHFQTLLESIVIDTDQKILEVPLLTEAESHQLLVDGKGPRADYTQDKCVHQLLEEQAARSPEHVALVCNDGQCTYSELNERANQLAHYLRTLGVGPETLVAISVGRSLDMVVGILGILKAGGSWLPLDPNYPKDRLAFMLRDSHVPFLLTEAHMAAGLPEHGAKTILIDVEWPLISEQSKANPLNLSSPTDLAYVVYTSGSTGRPNGVMIPHRSLCHYVHAMGNTLGMTTDEVYLHTATISFSSSVRQLMVPLVHGARVVIATSERIQQPVALFETIKEEGITIIDIVPSYWRHCLYALESLETATRKCLLKNQLRLVLTASEPLWSDLPRKWVFELEHPAKVINLFGQTETTGIVATYPVPRNESEGVEIIPIGRPIANTEIYVLDHQLRPVPAGVAGEIYIGGVGLGRGYLNQPELTAERFIPDPFSSDVGARLYKTGDLGRYSRDGHIQFVGRTDRQVKIRGFRIELAEIETALGQHPLLREAAVAVHKVVSGDPATLLKNGDQLVAYVVSSPEDSLAISDLRNFLKEQLPDYMIPSAFMCLDTLPKTPSGKVDFHSLPAPDQNMSKTENTYVAPRTPVEVVLCGIWSDILGIERPGIYDNFFELGGHSLLVIQVLSRVRSIFLVDLSLRTLFENPTVAELAVQIQAQAGYFPSQDIADVLADVESLSDEEAERLLSQERSKRV